MSTDRDEAEAPQKTQEDQETPEAQEDHDSQDSQDSQDAQDAQDGSSDESPGEGESRVKTDGDEVEAPEGKFPADAKGFDGTPVEQILKERDERLDPDNRPDNTEVSNAGREFDAEKGMFKDEDGYEEAEKQFNLEEP